MLVEITAASEYNIISYIAWSGVLPIVIGYSILYKVYKDKSCKTHCLKAVWLNFYYC